MGSSVCLGRYQPGLQKTCCVCHTSAVFACAHSSASTAHGPRFINCWWSPTQAHTLSRSARALLMRSCSRLPKRPDVCSVSSVAAPVSALTSASSTVSACVRRTCRHAPRPPQIPTNIQSLSLACNSLHVNTSYPVLSEVKEARREPLIHQDGAASTRRKSVLPELACRASFSQYMSQQADGLAGFTGCMPGAAACRASISTRKGAPWSRAALPASSSA